ncbi:MAG TPA: pyridoxamine 5'-phosphate oxidase family protein [Spirochaetota bacterium]|nr:pyridoxamine 5'-phosphate oxidase family protein [Spirochaetota bacterium]
MNITELKAYFEKTSGLAVLSTCDSTGNVNAAVYGKPHFIEGDVFALIMNDRVSHANLQTNPRAAYLFLEEGSKSKGIRIYLKKKGETDNPAEIDKFRKHHGKDGTAAEKKLFLVKFTVEKTREIIEK